MTTDAEKNYLELNKQLWNARVESHMASAFYDLDSFLKGRNSLTDPELELLGEVKGKDLLHLQCHFGQDTLSLVRMGAQVCGVDLSDTAIAAANQLATTLQLPATFICCDVNQTRKHLTKQFDIVYTSYGTIGWLPNLQEWARVIAQSLKPGGYFVFVEFHPVIWMYDARFTKIEYSYFNRQPIVETELGTYADKSAAISLQSVGWNHSIADVLSVLLSQGLQIEVFKEFDYSPHNCFEETIEISKGKFQIKHLKDKLPMVYSIKARKPL